MALTVNLIGPSPWGFRIFGGRDFKKAITVSKQACASGCVLYAWDTGTELKAMLRPISVEFPLMLWYSIGFDMWSATDKLSTQPEDTQLSILARWIASTKCSEQDLGPVNGGSKAEKANLQPGDIILEINRENTADMLNVEAQNKIKNSKTQLQLVVERPEPPSPGQTNGIGTPEQLTGRFQEAVIVSRDENQNYREYTISSPASLSPGPYSPDPFPSPDGKRERLTPTINK
ncbi:hypothetical protein FQN60_017827, partial [Etheostoma spectabile]